MSYINIYDVVIFTVNNDKEKVGNYTEMF